MDVLRKCSSFPVFLAALLVGLNFKLEWSFRIEPDTFWHTKLGESILATRHWPTVDTWSFTAHRISTMAYEWLGEVVMAMAWRLGGYRGLEALMILLTSAIVLLLYYYAYLRCGKTKAALIATVVTLPITAISFTLRPQLLGYIFLLITLICLERFRLGLQKSLWILPPVFLLWVNTHGSFVLGFMVLGLYWLGGLRSFSWGGLHGERWETAQRIHLELIGLLSLVVLPITPYGTRLAVVPLEYAFSLPLNISNINEWQQTPLNFWNTKLLLVLVLSFLIAQIVLRLRYRVEEIALFLFAGYEAFLHFRFCIFFALVFTPLFAAILARWMPAHKPQADKHAFNAIAVLGMVAAMVIYFPSQAQLEKKVATDQPVQAVAYLRQHSVPGPMFNNYVFGGYLVWALGPGHKVFIDGRGDVYERAGVFADYLRINTVKPDALALLRSYGIRSCLIQSDSPLATLLAARSDWKQVYKDKVSAIFVRQTNL